MSNENKVLGSNAIYVHTDPPEGLSEDLKQYWNEGISWGSPEGTMFEDDSQRIRTIADQFFNHVTFNDLQKGSSSIGMKSRNGANRDPSMRWACRELNCKATVGCFKVMQRAHPCVNSYCRGRCRYVSNRRMYPLTIHLPKHNPNCKHYCEPIDPLKQVAKGTKAYRSRLLAKKKEEVIPMHHAIQRHHQPMPQPPVMTGVQMAPVPVQHTHATSAHSASAHVASAHAASAHAASAHATSVHVMAPQPTATIAAAASTVIQMQGAGPVVEVVQDAMGIVGTAPHRKRPYDPNDVANATMYHKQQKI